MKQKEYVYRSSSDICDIHAWQWCPDDPSDIKAVIQMHHGMAEHCGRYKSFINAFVDMGYAVFMNDMLGHGKSNEDPELLGYFGEKDGYLNILADAKQLTDIAKKEYPDKKFIIGGHSMGSLIMRCYINQYGCDFDGAIFIGTAGPTPLAKAGLPIIFAVEKTKGAKHHSQLINKISMGPYDKKFEHRTHYDWGISDPKQVDEYVNDDLCGFIFTAAGYRDLAALTSQCNEKIWFENVKKDMPVLLASGTEDPVGDYSFGVKKVYDLLIQSGHTKVSLKLYKNLRHEILNEIGKERVYSDINEWIEKKVLA